MPVGSQSRFATVAAAGAAAVVVYTVWITLQIGGAGAGQGVAEGGEALAALLAAAACALAAQRDSGRTRTAWTLFAISAASWGAGQTAATVSEVAFGISAAFPSPANAGYLAAIVFAVAAIVFFPSAPTRTINATRAVLDAAVVALCVLFVAWAVGLGALYSHATEHLSRFVDIAYPTADVLVITLLATTLRVPAPFRTVTVLLLAAYGANLLADGPPDYFDLSGRVGRFAVAFDAFRVIAFLLLALAALWTAGESATRVGEEQPELWQLATPWVAALVVMLTAALTAATGRQTGPGLAWIGDGFGVAFVATQMIALGDSLRLIRRSRRVEAALREQSALTSQIIGNAPLGIARVGENFRFIDANPRLCEMLGIPSRALIGTPLTRFISAEEAEKARKRMELMRAGKMARAEVDTEMVTGDGRKLWVHRVVTPVFDSNAEVDYYIVMFEDATAKHESEQAALANLAAMERLSRLKSEFVAQVSHEFRSALTGMQGFSEVLKTEDVAPEEVKEFGGVINEDAQRLNRMITEMLDLDRMESGRMELHMQEVDLNEVLDECAERARMSTNAHRILTEIDPHHRPVVGDRDRLTQVVTNLLNNAIKYSPGGGDIELVTRSEDGAVEVSVRDHGPGIAADFLPRIFGRYERYDGGGTAKLSGTGLGLAIAQQIVQLHGGRIWVESRPGEGAVFRFTIPAA